MGSDAVGKAHSVPLLAITQPDHAVKCKYVITGGKLGDGHFSVVKECMNVHTRDIFALKMVHKAMMRDKLQLMKKEVSLLASVSEKVKKMEESEHSSTDVFDGHHHILQMFDYFETDEHIALVMQLCDKGDLFEKIITAGHLDLETQVKSYTACLVSVLEFLHEQNIVHRDLKAENVLFRLRINSNEPTESRGEFPYDLTAHDLILADFGFATNIGSDTKVKDYVGTLSYIAPEIVSCKDILYMSESQANAIEPYGSAVDMWALGVLTYFMALGYMPFDCDSDAETLESIKSRDYYVDADVGRNPKMSQFWSFINICFRVSAHQRPDAAELKRHPFIGDYFAITSTPDHAVAIPYSMERSKSLRSPKAPNKSPSYTNIAYMRLDPPFNVSMTPANSGPILDAEMAAKRQRDLMQVRHTLKRTLSTTTLQRELPILPNATKDFKNSSTFVLEPQPPSNSLMNGCYSTTPQSGSSLNTPMSASRKTSSTSFQHVQNTPKVPNINDDHEEDEGIII